MVPLYTSTLKIVILGQIWHMDHRICILHVPDTLPIDNSGALAANIIRLLGQRGTCKLTATLVDLTLKRSAATTVHFNAFSLV